MVLRRRVPVRVVAGLVGLAAGLAVGTAGLASYPRLAGSPPVVQQPAATQASAGQPAADRPTEDATPVSRFRWPLDGVPTVVRPFAPPPQPWLSGHRGVDIAGHPGAQVRAAGPGTVRYAGDVAGRGVVSIEHAGGLRTTYEPVAASVQAGQRVVAGDVIGSLLAGHAGCPVAACLHWGLRKGAAYLDPRSLLGLGRVRLLPHVEVSAYAAGAGSPAVRVGGRLPMVWTASWLPVVLAGARLPTARAHDWFP